MLELIKYIVLQFADHKEDCQFKEEENNGVVTITIYLNSEDMGKVIGRQGKIAKALRTLVKAASSKSGKKYNVEIAENN